MQAEPEGAQDKSSKKETRNLVLCFDGTGDWVGTDDTNVAKIYHCLSEDNQVRYYDGGVGTLTDPRALSAMSRTWMRLVDLGTATSLRDKVLGGYSFLVNNYRQGDKIFLFGFSRGAYTARVLAAMLKNFGLLRQESENLAPYLWQTISSFATIKDFKIAAAKIRSNFARKDIDSPLIHFMGLFDTVSSVGVIGRFNTHPNTDFNDEVARVCHAVSIDEARNVFPEALMHPGQPGLTEVWFPGVHRDIGGGLPKNASRIADEALHWIETEARASGLRLMEAHQPDPTLAPGPNYPPYDPYVFAGLYPMKMFIKRVSGFRVLWPDFRHVRTVPEYSLIHEVAFELKEAEGSTYNPLNWPDNCTGFKTGDDKASPDRYILKPLPRLPEAAGTVLGTAAIFLLWNSIVGSPFGSSWPYARGSNFLSALLNRIPFKDFLFGKTHWHIPLTGWAVIAAFVLFMASQFIGQRFTERRRSGGRPSQGGASLVVTAILMLAILAFNPSWTTLLVGIGVGVVFSVFGQWLPGPVLNADLTLPRVLMAGFVSALFYGLYLLLFKSPALNPQLVLILIAIVYLALGCGSLMDDRRKIAEEERKMEPVRLRIATLAAQNASTSS